MSTSEGLQPLASASGIPTDPNVVLPEGVKNAGSAADELHRRLYSKEAPAPEAPSKTAPLQEPVAATNDENKAPNLVTPVTATVSQPAPTEIPPLKPGEENVSPDDWRLRFLSMQGRFHASQKTIGSMEQQMAQLGQELLHVQNQLASAQTMPPQDENRTAQGHVNRQNFITDQDRADYGDDLINLTQRAALEIVGPEIDRLRAQNQQLQKRVQSTSKREMFAWLDSRLPEWRQLNNDTRFKTWLRLPNIYTGQVRSEMLSRAVEGAQAPVVLQFFQDFLREAHATGQQVQAQQVEQPGVAPRTAAVDLATLATPGRAKPASGESQVPSEKPIYTRAQISKFFEDSRRGLYDGRKAEYEAIQADLTNAQREGRIR